jgi:adenylylsulfate kinase-like enzyme
MITWITGNSGAGKTRLARRLMRPGTILLDGDEVRRIWPELGFSKEDRWQNNLRVARLAKLLDAQDYEVIVATICPYAELRAEVKRITNCRFVYLDEGKQASGEYPYEQ